MTPSTSPIIGPMSRRRSVFQKMKKAWLTATFWIKMMLANWNMFWIHIGVRKKRWKCHLWILSIRRKWWAVHRIGIQNEIWSKTCLSYVAIRKILGQQRKNRKICCWKKCTIWTEVRILRPKGHKISLMSWFLERAPKIRTSRWYCRQIRRMGSSQRGIHQGRNGRSWSKIKILMEIRSRRKIILNLRAVASMIKRSWTIIYGCRRWQIEYCRSSPKSTIPRVYPSKIWKSWRKLST